MKYTVYNSSGEIVELLSITNPDVIESMLDGRSYVEGHYDSNAYYIDQGQACAKPLRPTHEYIQYAFDSASKSWTTDLSQTTESARALRDSLLSAIDRVNPVWYSSLTTEQQQALVVYRQQLLDVPQQAGFPEAVEWPAKPTWL